MEPKLSINQKISSKIKENLKKMFDGDKFWNFCGGVWEKSISLRNRMMKIAIFFMQLLAFCLPLMSSIIGGAIINGASITYENADRNNTYTCGLGNITYTGSQCLKLNLLWFLTLLVVWPSHLVGWLVYGTSLKEFMKSVRIEWLRFNRILILALVGLQAYFTYQVASIDQMMHSNISKFGKANFELNGNTILLLLISWTLYSFVTREYIDYADSEISGIDRTGIQTRPLLPDKTVFIKYLKECCVVNLALLPAVMGLSFVPSCILIWILGTETGLTNVEIGIWFLTAIIQGVLFYGFAERRSGILTFWLFVSFIVIVGLAVNFGYGTVYYSDSAFYIHFGVAFGLYLFRSIVADVQQDMNELKKSDATQLDKPVKV